MKEQTVETLQEGGAIDLYPLPDGWKWVTVGDAGAYQKNAIVDGPFGSNLKVSDYVEDGPVPVLTTKNLEGNYDKVRYISNEKFEELKRSAVYPGDILMAKIGSCGKTGIYPANKPPAMIPANLLKVTLNDQFELKYVYHYFNSTFFQKALRTITKATAQPAFGVTNFRKLPLPYTARDQQKRIVAEIEKQFSRLDEAVANLKRVKANLKRYKATVLKAAVEGRLVETEAERARREGRSFETGEQLLQRIFETRRSQWKGRGKYKEPAAPDTSDLPELPEGWVWATVGQISSQVQYGYTASAIARESGVRFLRITDIQDERVDWSTVPSCDISKNERRELLLQTGDIVFARTGATVGKSFQLKGSFPDSVFASYLIRISPHNEQISDWLSIFFHSSAYWHQIRETQAGIGQPNVNGTKLRAVVVPLPPVAEQQRIAPEIYRRFSILRETEAQVDANLQRAERLRQSILSKAFTRTCNEPKAPFTLY